MLWQTCSTQGTVLRMSLLHTDHPLHPLHMLTTCTTKSQGHDTTCLRTMTCTHDV